jgi:chromosome partitioning protein
MATQTRVIGVMSTKGGVGRTTLTVNLAVTALRECDGVAILDVDPQQSAVDWWECRGKPSNIYLRADAADPVGNVRRLSLLHPWVFIDGPPKDVDAIAETLEPCHLVVIVTRVGRFDLKSIPAMVGLCRKAKKPFLFVLNQTVPEREAGTLSAIRQLKKLGPIASKVVRFRTIYESGLGKGLAGSEADDVEEAKAADKEMKAVWNAIKSAVRASQ